MAMILDIDMKPRFGVRTQWGQGVRSKKTRGLKYEPYVPLVHQDAQDCLVGDLLMEVGTTKSRGSTLWEIPVRTKSGRPSKKRLMTFRCFALLNGGIQMPPLASVGVFEDGVHEDPTAFLPRSDMRMWLWIRQS